MEYKHIIYQPGKVTRIILNRPRYYNAQSRLMRDEMDDAFVRAAEDDQVGAIVLSGEGKHFSAGHDLGTPEELEEREKSGFPTTTLGRYKRTRALCLENSLRWRNVPKPTIAMVHGYCIFGGWIFAAAMDVLFASEDTLFLPSHVQYFSMPWDIGPRKTKEILFEHRFMTAWEAYQHGFVNRVFPRERLEEETLAYAGRVADNYIRDPARLRTVKFSANHMQDTLGYTTELETAYQSYFIATELRDTERPLDDKGGIAQASLAHKNLEASQSWLESTPQQTGR
ncbi:MAG: enoyl-CoA hydratase/isomerase family protein [Dehalococcoidales bacterium]|nr:enoyl-CoA hydratase/isomerase family protein [Dehalococcoidales bacterium]